MLSKDHDRNLSFETLLVLCNKSVLTNHCIFQIFIIFIASVHSFFILFFFLNLVLLGRRNGPRYQRVLDLCDFFFLNRGDTERTNSPKILCSIFVYVLFYVNLCTGLILWLLNTLWFDDLRAE